LQRAIIRFSPLQRVPLGHWLQPVARKTDTKMRCLRGSEVSPCLESCGAPSPQRFGDLPQSQGT
ncbi:hypothetical protein JXA47_05830, partial [Candidatus Sumerlaeota bacterium]|nr:hypothetical protein [Candidatus Sumerlaeota bacterium]